MGREIGVYDNITKQMRMFNIYGQGMIGRIEPKFVLKNGVDPEGEPYSYYERTDKRFYYINDHLGSIRLTINEDNTISSAQDYNAFGGILPGRSYVSGSAINMYKFTGKERDTESNLDYFGARFYDSEIGRWLSVDPLADKYPGWSPYNYCLNNPLNFIDPDGMQVGDYWDENGNYIGNDGIDDNKNYIVPDMNYTLVSSILNISGLSGNDKQIIAASSSIIVPDQNVVAEMAVAVLRATSFNEEGGIMTLQKDGTQGVMHAISGGKTDPSEDSKAHIDLYDSKNPEGWKDVSKELGTFHLHPDGINNGYGFNQPPSLDDFRTAKSNLPLHNYVLGMRSNKVYIHNNKTILATFPLSNFLKFGK